MVVTLQRDRGTHVMTRVEIDLGQWVVMLDGRGVGYVCDPPGSPLNLIERFSEWQREQIRAAVAEQLGWEPRLVSEPPDMTRAKRRAHTRG